MGIRISIMNIPEISAIYFALLQSGYNYYAIEKEIDIVESIKKFKLTCDVFESEFFSEAKQNTCEVYPYWPRATLLEAATFYLDSTNSQFVNFDLYRFKILNADNISDDEKDITFWEWIRKFPSALCNILFNDFFQFYLNWEKEWIEQQKHVLVNDLSDLEKILTSCSKHFGSAIQEISVVLNPIKCAYSADYHLIEGQLFFCFGGFQKEFVMHEFLHHIVHPFITEHRGIILQHRGSYPGIDASYYLSGDELGRLNAFEEYLVRKLTPLAIIEDLPSDIGMFIEEILTI